MATVNSKTGPSLRDSQQNRAMKRGFVSDSIATGVIFALVLTLGQRVVGFGRGILFCRLMSDQELGQWSMVWSYLMLLAPLAVLGLPGCFGKFTEHYRQRGQLKSFVGRIAWISLALTILFSGAIVFFPTRCAWVLFRDPTQSGLVQLMGFALLAVSASNFLATLMESLRQVRAVSIMRFISGIAFAVVGTGLLLICQDGASATTVAFAASCLIGMIPVVWVLWKSREGIVNEGEPLTQSTMWKRIAPFAIWMWATNLLSNLIEVSDRYMLLHCSNVSPDLAQSSVGQYHSGRVVPLLLVSVAAMLAGVLIPYLSHAWERGEHSKARKQLNWSFKLVALSFTAAGALFLVASPVLFDWILQGRYNGGRSILPLTLVYCIWLGLVTVAQDYLWVAEQGKWATLVTAAGLIVNVVLNLVLIPWIGLHGAVIGTACGNAVLVILIVVLNHHFGCTADRGIWLCAALPLLLLLSTPMAVLAVLIVGLATFTTEWVLTGNEKAELRIAAQNKLSRFLPAR